MQEKLNEIALLKLIEKKSDVLYGLYDAAQGVNLLDEFQKNGISHDCLFSGIKEITLRDVAPYLFSCHQFGKNSEYFTNNIWKKGVSMLLEGAEPMEKIKFQLKKNTYVKNSKNAECYFRYYDARAFSRFMRIANAGQLDQLFGSAIQTIYWLDVKTNGIVGLNKKRSSFIDRFLDSGSSNYNILKFS